MASARFSYKDSRKKVQFIDKTFLLVNINIEIVLEMLFLVYNILNFQYCVEKLI